MPTGRGVDVVPDVGALLRRSDIDLVVVAAPNAQHHPVARGGAGGRQARGGRQAFHPRCGPGARTRGAGTAPGRLLSVYQNRRFDSDFLSLRDLLARRELGRPVFFESHFDRFRPQVRERWREQPVPGAGLWVDLGAHLVDQAVQLFGRPDTLQLDTAALRERALVEDYFHAVLRYESGEHAPLRVVLHATTLAAFPAPRYIVHGTRGSYLKRGVDPQEDALRAGGRPGDARVGRRPGRRRTHAGGAGWQRTHAEAAHAGRATTSSYYAAVRDAILGKGPNPVTPEQAVELMELLDLGSPERGGRPGPGGALTGRQREEAISRRDASCRRTRHWSWSPSCS